MDYKKLGIIVALCLCVIVGTLIFIRDHVIEKTVFIPDITDLTKNYLATEEIEAAKEALADPNIKPVEVITTLQDGTPRVAIVFDGMPDRPLASRLIDVLKKHKAEAVFFVEGENIADQPEVLQVLRDGGQEIGNYTYAGLAAMERQSVDQQLLQLCRAQKVITMNDALAPTLFRAPRTVFTDDLLKSVRAAGLSYAVKENVRFQPRSLHNQQEADAYAASIPRGSIIAIPINHPVEQKANDPVVRDEKPAVDMKPTIHDDNSANLPPQEDLATEMDLLLTALEHCGLQTAYVNQFRKIYYIPAASPLPETPPQGGAK